MTTPRLVCALIALALLAPLAPAATIDLTFGELDLVYDGTAIRDAATDDGDGVVATPVAEMGPPDPSLLAGTKIDFFLPEIAPISAEGGSTTSGQGGWLLLMLPGGEQVKLSLDSVTINYIDFGGVARFAFGAAVAEVYAPSEPGLSPNALSLAPAASVSFSTAVSEVTAANGVLTSFKGKASGEVRGATVIPEPTTGVALVLLLGVGSAAALMRAKLG
ncbi:hypothetical protein MalM25_01710 [Planctomycetes bacterium MalM25]|nr:hypothetical protein MalM25_01710 [Planctomycetes bacterium MalM25]